MLTDSDDKTKLIPPAPVPTTESGPAMVRLWYCQRCTTLILPPGERGKMAEDGQHYCTTCAPFEVQMPPSTAVFDSIGPNRTFTDMVPETAGAAASRFNSRSQNSAATGKKSSRLWIGVGLAATAALLFVGIKLMRPSAPPAKPGVTVKSTSEQPSVVKTIVIDGSQDSVTADKAQVVETPKQGGLFATMQQGTAVPANGSPTAIPSPATTDRKAVGANGIDAANRKPGESQETLRTTTNIGAPTVPVAAAPAIPIETFEAQLVAFDPLLKEDKFADADRLLRVVSLKFAKAEWWPEQKQRVTQLQMTLTTRKDEFIASSREAVEKTVTITTPAELDSLAKIWEAKSRIPGTTKQKADEVLKAICEARKRIAEDADSTIKKIEEDLDLLAKRTPASMPKAKAIELVNDIQSRMAGNAHLKEKLGEKVFNAYYDVNISQSQERTVFGVTPQTRGVGKQELLYDFSSREQADAWKFEADAPQSDAYGLAYEESRRMLQFKVSGEHKSETNPKKPLLFPPLAKLPFCFEGKSAWTLEVMAGVLRTNQKDRKDINPEFGILISDGKSFVKASVRSDGKNKMKFFGRGFGEDKEVAFQKNPEEQVPLKMIYSDNRFTLYSGSSSKQVDLRAPLGFEPKYIAVTVETYEKEANTVVAFSSMKFAGTLSPDKVREHYEKRRSEAFTHFKAQGYTFAKPTGTAPKK